VIAGNDQLIQAFSLCYKKIPTGKNGWDFLTLGDSEIVSALQIPKE
jgi:hypothetical protein